MVICGGTCTDGPVGSITVKRSVAADETEAGTVCSRLEKP